MKKKIAIFDIDGTLFRNSLLIELHWKLVREGVIKRSEIKRVDKLYWKWVLRKGSYQDYLDEVIDNFDSYIKGVPVRTVNRLSDKVVKAQSEIIYRFTRDLIKKLKKDHILVALSGSPIAVVKAFAKFWDFDYAFGTVHETKRGRYTGKKLFTPSVNKKAALQRFLKNMDLEMADVGVGDTETDVGVFELSKHPICFNPTSGLYKIAKKRKWKVFVERKDVVYKVN